MPSIAVTEESKKQVEEEKKKLAQQLVSLQQKIQQLEAQREGRKQVEEEKKKLAQQLASLQRKIQQLEAQREEGGTAPRPIAGRWAVVVGISAYRDLDIPTLQYADADARAFANFLRSRKGGSFPAEHVRVFLNEQATLVNLRSAFGKFLKQAQKDDLVVIYFAAHGMPEPGRTDTTYFMPYDAKLDDLYATALPMDEMGQVLNRRIYSEKVVMIADTCHSGFVGTQTRGAVLQAAETTNRFFSELAKAKPGRAIFTASSASELSQEHERWGGGHGVFTYYLLEGLKGKADGDKNGVVTIREAFDYTYRQVAKATANDQHPELKGTFDNNIPLAVVQQ